MTIDLLVDIVAIDGDGGAYSKYSASKEARAVMRLHNFVQSNLYCFRGQLLLVYSRKHNFA